MTNPNGAAVAAPSSTARPSFFRYALIAALFLLFFAGTCGVIHSLLPFPSVPDLAPRFRYFAEHKNEFDTIFIGSSHVRHGVIPQQFDDEMTKRNAPTRSFNLGFSGMWPPESFYYLRQVLALHPKKLRWVFIELMDFREQAEGESSTTRSVYWHDAMHTGMAWRLVSESPKFFAQKADLFADHAWQFAQNMTNPGRGAEWLSQHYFPTKKKSDASWIVRRGFDPEPETERWPLEGISKYRRQIAEFQLARRQTHLRLGFGIALHEIAREVEQAGAKPIFIILPTVRAEEHFDASSLPGLGPILAFDDPAQLPRLYDPELHYDPGHLSAAGAREFSSLLAERFAGVALPSPF